MISLRQIANCMGLSGNVSLLHDIHGYLKFPWGSPLSLLSQFYLLKGKHIHLNIIMVGYDQLEDEDFQEISNALRLTRRIYKQWNFGIGRVRYHAMPTSVSNGHETIDDFPEASDLTNEVTIPNDGIDAFVVLHIGIIDGSDIDGVSPAGHPGPCDKSEDGGGIIVELSSGATGFTLAHELGHYLGLGHVDDNPDNPDNQKNMMFPVMPHGIKLTDEQINTIKAGCFVKDGC